MRVTGRLLGVGLSAVVLAATAACGSRPAAAPGTDSYTIGVTTLFASPIIKEYTDGMQKAVEGTGITLKINTSDSNVAKEASIIDTYITQRVDAILIDPISASGSIPAVQRAVDAGIPVVCYDTCIDADAKAKYVKAFVTSDQTGLGRMAGEAAATYIKDSLGGKAMIGILSCDESYAICGQRKDGFLSALEPGSYEVVAKQEGYVVDKARPLASDMLTANPDINLIFGENEGSTIGAALAIASDKRTGVHVFGIDITTVIAGLMLEPDPALLFTAGQGAGDLGAKAVAATTQVLRGATPTGTEYARHLPYSADDRKTLDDYIAQRR